LSKFGKNPPSPRPGFWRSYRLGAFFTPVAFVAPLRKPFFFFAFIRPIRVIRDQTSSSSLPLIPISSFNPVIPLSFLLNPVHPVNPVRNSSLPFSPSALICAICG